MATSLLLERSLSSQKENKKRLPCLMQAALKDTNTNFWKFWRFDDSRTKLKPCQRTFFFDFHKEKLPFQLSLRNELNLVYHQGHEQFNSEISHKKKSEVVSVFPSTVNNSSLLYFTKRNVQPQLWNVTHPSCQPSTRKRFQPVWIFIPLTK